MGKCAILKKQTGPPDSGLYLLMSRDKRLCE
nr:MAG TPA: hypothetical protein [Caudoviricetes sp.]